MPIGTRVKDSLSHVTERISSTWSGLEERDRKTLGLAAPVILLLVLYLVVFQPVHSRYSQARHDHQELSDTLLWLYDNAPLIERVQNACSRQRLVVWGDKYGKDIQSYAKDIGRRAGISPDIRAGNSNDLNVQAKNAPGNRALASIQAYACHGFVVSELQLDRPSADSTQVNLSFRLSASNLLRAN